MALAAAKTRFGRIKFKSGGEMRLLPPRDSTEVGKVLEMVSNTLNNHISHDSNIEGFAFLVWDADRAYTSKMYFSPESRIPAILLPEFVKAALYQELVIHNTFDEMSEGDS